MAETDLDLPMAQCTNTTPPSSLACLINSAARMASSITYSSISSQSFRLMYFTPSAQKWFFSSMAAFTMWVTLFRYKSYFLLILHTLSPSKSPQMMWAAWKLLWVLNYSFSIQCPHFQHLVQIQRFLNSFSPASYQHLYLIRFLLRFFLPITAAFCTWLPPIPLRRLNEEGATELSLSVYKGQMLSLMMKSI